MRIVVALVNGEFHAHRADCADAAPDAPPFDVDNYEGVAWRCYGQFLRNGMDMGEALDCITFNPCTKGLTYAACAA